MKHFVTLLLLSGPVNVRSHPTPEAPGNSIGLEAIIRKALMGKFDDSSEERSPSNTANQMGSGVSADGRAEDSFSQGEPLQTPLNLINLFIYFMTSSQYIWLDFILIELAF